MMNNELKNNLASVPTFGSSYRVHLRSKCASTIHSGVQKEVVNGDPKLLPHKGRQLSLSAQKRE